MIATYIYEVTDPPLALFLLYIVITVLAMASYKLGFARKLPILKSLLVYVMLAIGCVILTLFGVVMPIAEILLISVFVMGIAYYRRKKSGAMERRPLN